MEKRIDVSSSAENLPAFFFTVARDMVCEIKYAPTEQKTDSPIKDKNTSVLKEVERYVSSPKKAEDINATHPLIAWGVMGR